MSTEIKTKSSAVRERLTHAVIDADGHMIEYPPMLLEYMREVGGQSLVDRYTARLPISTRNFDGGIDRVGGPYGWFGLTPQQRQDMRVTSSGYWGLTTKTLDRATVMLPKLLRERLDDLGTDFAIIYGSTFNHFSRDMDAELRVGGCRALNRMYADLFRSHADRICMAAIIPTGTPQEAIEELDYAVNTLGFKAAVFGTLVRRPIAYVAQKNPELAQFATWLDVLGISSDYDYDPLWKRCVELRIPVASHTGSMGVGFRASPTSWVNNHIGHFAAGNEAFCKAVVLGGVAERFPELTIAFLEGGVGWACQLYNQFIEYWEKRNVSSIRGLVDPAQLDQQRLGELFERYGEGRFNLTNGGSPTAAATADEAKPKPEEMDEWKGLNINDGRKFKKWFENFYFGCEADDRIVALAFNPKVNHYDTKLQAIYSSDVAHFDVPDITTVLAEAYELVEDKLLTPEDFRDFTLTNVVTLYTKMRPDFFDGTAVEAAAKSIMKERGIGVT